MGSLRNLIVAALASAIVLSGVLPPDHLHRSTSTRPDVLHAHWEAASGFGDQGVFSHHDGHDDAVTFDRVLAAGRAGHVFDQAAALPQAISVDVAVAADAAPLHSDVTTAPSPPPRPSPPRAPPA